MDQATIAFYDRDAESYAQSAVDHGVRDSLARFESALSRSARVLDYGCGAGQESAWLAERGHTVTSMDASPGLAAEAKRRFGIDVTVGDFLALNANSAFDGVWAGASLHHAQTNDLPVIIARVSTSLKPGGIFAGILKAGEDRRDSLGRFYCGIDAPRFRAMLEAADFTELDMRDSVGTGYDQIDTPWIIFAARKAAA
jgi:SAM-dependent methyltransferase